MQTAVGWRGFCDLLITPFLVFIPLNEKKTIITIIMYCIICGVLNHLTVVRFLFWACCGFYTVNTLWKPHWLQYLLSPFLLYVFNPKILLHIRSYMLLYFIISLLFLSRGYFWMGPWRATYSSCAQWIQHLFMTTGKRKTNMSVHITSVLFLKAPLAFAPLCYRYLTDYLFLSVCLSFSFYFICVSGLWAAMTKSYEFNWQKHLPEYMQEGRLFDRFDEVKIAHFSDVYEVPTILMKI